MPQQNRGQFRQHMQNMRSNYRGQMQAGGLDKNQIQQRMKAMRQHQRSNRSQYANQYMKQQVQQPPAPMQGYQQPQMQPGIPNSLSEGSGQLTPGLMNPSAQPQMNAAIYGNPTLSAPEQQQAMQGPSNRWNPPAPGQMPGQGQMQQAHDMYANPSTPAQPPSNKAGPTPQIQQPQRQNPYERFNQRGRPAPSRANLLPAQQNTWKQRMSGGMRGSPGAAPMQANTL